MDQITRTNLEEIRSNDRVRQGEAFQYLMAATRTPVDWGYEAWDELLKDLRAKDNRLRSIAAQLLCSLAKSDPEERMVRDLPALLAVTKDEQFVTARHCMQSLWKVGVEGERQRRVLLDGLAARFQDCVSEKNCTLIRYDILESLRKVYDVVADEAIRQLAMALIETEADLKYRRKYATLWKK